MTPLFSWSYTYAADIGSRREKESMKAELTALAGQKETTYHGEKERAVTDLEFFSWFSFVFLTGWVTVSL